MPLRPRSSAQARVNLAQPAFPRARWQFCRKTLDFPRNQPADQATVHMSLRLCKQTPPLSHLYNCEVPDAPAVQSAAEHGGVGYAGQLRSPRAKLRRARAPASNPQPNKLANPHSTALTNSGHERRRTWPRRCLRRWL